MTVQYSNTLAKRYLLLRSLSISSLLLHTRQFFWNQVTFLITTIKMVLMSPIRWWSPCWVALQWLCYYQFNQQYFWQAICKNFKQITIWDILTNWISRWRISTINSFTCSRTTTSTQINGPPGHRVGNECKYFMKWAMT